MMTLRLPAINPRKVIMLIWPIKALKPPLNISFVPNVSVSNNSLKSAEPAAMIKPIMSESNVFLVLIYLGKR